MGHGVNRYKENGMIDDGRQGIMRIMRIMRTGGELDPREIAKKKPGFVFLPCCVILE